MSPLTISLTLDQLAELKHLITHAERPEVRRRAHIIILLHAGYSPTHLARELNVSRKTVYNVAHSFELHGIDGLFTRSYPGRPGKADAHYRDLLEEVLAHAPADYGYGDLGWTTRLIQEHMAQETGVTLSLSRLRDLLHKLGYAYKRQRPHVDSMLPAMPEDWRDISHWLDQRHSLKATLPDWMFRPYTSWVKAESD